MKYSLPVCATLYGHEGAQFGLPVLMTSLNENIVFYINEKNPPKKANCIKGDKQLEEILKEGQKYIEGLKIKPEKVFIENTFSLDSPDILGTIIAGIVITLAGVKAKDAKLSPVSVQAGAYHVEKKILKDKSHAQSVTALQNSLVFYRKEFEFYRTVMRMPMKIPQNLLDKAKIAPILSEKVSSGKFEKPEDSSKYIKKLVLALQKEDNESIIKALVSK